MLDLTPSLTLLSLLALLSLLLLYFLSHTTKRNPCPESHPILGNLLSFLRNRHRFHDWVTHLLSTTTTTIQVNGLLGLSHGVCTADPAVVDHLLRSNFANYVKGSRFSSVLHELLGLGIFNVDAHLWTAQRKIASHEFNTKSLKQFVSDTVQSHLSHRLIPVLSEACDDGLTVDLQEVFRRFAFDNVCNVAFGVDPGWLDTNRTKTASNSVNASFVQAFDYAVELTSDRFMSPVPAVWKIKRILNVGSERKFKEAIAVIDDFAMNIIRSKERECDQIKEDKDQDHSQDLLSRFMSSTSSKDSTSTALTWFFWLIAGHPQCERLIYGELAAAVKASPTGLPTDFSYDELKKLNYLHAALSESLRLFPPVPINSRLAVADDILPDGTYVGKGWFADYSAYAMARMEKLWGPDCREFKPERWLNIDGVFQPSDQFKFPVFHSGPRMCLGKDMAYLQMKSIAAAVMYEFEIEVVDGGGDARKMIEPPYTLSLLLKMRGGLPVRMKRRP
ncbi:hypothetical protein RHGRI_002055 [Rhododendron griersonianum]|uniref:Cytochrome P450 n=1 Tax=Rhododendron griersonianum TaxID=479676 RepID=A0AAV6LRA9_9ERIC|nr:hypothetical protein RHGRI_002055 [Rhododendron griersonianum]